MTATLETSLLERLAKSVDAVDRACVKAELAAHIARLGRYAEAEAMVSELRSTPQWGSARASSLILFAEAMIRLRDEFDLAALDRLNRGFAISSAVGSHQIATAFASWLAHFNFNRSQFFEMRKWLSYCNDHVDALSPSTASRVYLTMADATRYAGDFVGSDHWYSRSRQQAVAIGDESFLAANMYNRAAYGIARLRLNWARSELAPELLSRSRLEIESATNYSRATRNTAAEHLQQLWLGRSIQLRGEHSDAVPLLEAALESLPEAKHLKLRTPILIDIAYSKHSTANPDAHSALHELALSIDGANLDPDDKIVCLAQLKGIADANAIPVSAQLNGLLSQAIADHATTTSEVALQLTNLNFSTTTHR
jgi:hypothetical protein